ncbi:hypothetical protein IFR05_017063, partial [Cadophora sp. M221]
NSSTKDSYAPWRPDFSSPTLPELPRKQPAPVKQRLLPPSPQKIAQARDYYLSHPGMSVAKACRAVGIYNENHWRNLQRIIKHGQLENKGRKKLLTEHEELVVYRYIEAQAFAGFVADLDMGQQIRTLVQLRKPAYNGPSDSFLQSFTHTPEFKHRIRSTVSKPIDRKRKTAHDIQELKK